MHIGLGEAQGVGVPNPDSQPGILCQSLSRGSWVLRFPKPIEGMQWQLGCWHLGERVGSMCSAFVYYCQRGREAPGGSEWGG